MFKSDYLQKLPIKNSTCPLEDAVEISTFFESWNDMIIITNTELNIKRLKKQEKFNISRER